MIYSKSAAINKAHFLPPNPIKGSTRHGAPDSLDFKSICLQMNAGVRGWRAWLAAHLASLPVTWAVDTYELQHQSPSHHLINSFTFTQQSSSHFKPLWLIWRRCFMSVLEWKVIYDAQHASLIVIKRLNGYLFFFPLSPGWLKLLVWWRILPDLCGGSFL